MRDRLSYLCRALGVDKMWQPGLVSDGQVSLLVEIKK